MAPPFFTVVVSEKEFRYTGNEDFVVLPFEGAGIGSTSDPTSKSVGYLCVAKRVTGVGAQVLAFYHKKILPTFVNNVRSRSQETVLKETVFEDAAEAIRFHSCGLVHAGAHATL